MDYGISNDSWGGILDRGQSVSAVQRPYGMNVDLLLSEGDRLSSPVYAFPFALPESETSLRSCPREPVAQKAAV